MKSKFVLYLLLALAIIAIGAFLFYQFIYRGKINTTAGVVGQTGSLPSTANQQFPAAGSQTSTVNTFNAGATNSSSSKFGVVSNDPGLDYFVDGANTVTLVKPDGTIESISNNKSSVVSSSLIPNIISVGFSYDGKKVLVASEVGTTTRSGVFDVASRVWINLPNGMQNPVWSPVNYQIAYLTPSNSGSEALTMITMGATSSKPIVLSSLAMEDMVLRWPNANTIVISDRPSAYTVGSIWSFTISSKTASLISYENLGSESLWNASGSALIFSTKSNNAGGQLALQDPLGTQKIFSLLTLPSKCVFGPPVAASSTSPAVFIYCGMPRDQDTLSMVRLPDEYDQNIYFTDDDFYRIDAGTGSLSQIFSSSMINQTIDATRMKIFNNILFFINRYDQKIYALSL